MSAQVGVARADHADDTVDDAVLTARAFLSRAAEPAFIPLWALVRRFGPLEAVARLRCGDVGPDLQNLARRVAEIDPEADLVAAARHGVRLVVPESEEWPHFAMAALERTGEQRLARYEAGQRAHSDSGEDIPPLALWVRGRLNLGTLAVRSAGVVGARSATSYGQRVAADLGYGLALRDFVVVSGGAYGIDVAAHRGALAAGGATVIVSAGGVERPYPPTHADLFDRVLDQGAIVSESPVGSAPRRRRFLTRNRLIAAFSTGTIVVEASARSGALNTANHADRLGRPVLAVPGPVTSAQSVGCHTLLRGGAALTTGVDDVLEYLGSASDVSAPGIGIGGSPTQDVSVPDTARRGRAESALRARLDVLEPEARAVYDGMPARHEITVDALAASCAVSPLEVVRAIPALELAGLVEATRDGYRRTRSA